MSADLPRLPLFLAGALALLVLSVSKLPPLPELLRAPATPFDRSIPAATSDYRLMLEAAAVIPAGASVSPVSEPRDAVRETSLHREAVSLLPGRKVVPAAIWDTPTLAEDEAEFLIVSGPRPARQPGDLMLETPRGSVWRRRGP